MTKYHSNLLPDPWLIGFDKLWSSVDNRVQSSFPFYNIVKIDDHTFGIELAVSGFEEKDITIEEHKSTLKIEGKREEDKRHYIHKGITAKHFTRSFVLAEHVHVLSADLENGILKIVLQRDVPEDEKPKRIAIGA